MIHSIDISKKKKFLVSLGVGALTFLLAAWIVLRMTSPLYKQELTVLVVNVGDMELQSVKVIASGKEYEMGTLLPGREKSAAILPSAETDLKVEAIDLRGKKIEYPGFGYYEPGSVGDVTIELTQERIVKVDEDISISVKVPSA